MAAAENDRRRRQKSPNFEAQLLIAKQSEYHDRVLKFSWVTWLNFATASPWHAGLGQCGMFDTYELFWNELKRMPLPTQMKQGWNLYVFKENIQPLWEHPINADGGCWVVIFNRNEPCINLYWYKTLLAIVTDLFKPYDQEVCGVVFQRKKTGDKICIWTTDAFKNGGAGVRAIGSIFKNQLQTVNGEITVNYVTHKDYADNDRPVKNHTYTV